VATSSRPNTITVERSDLWICVCLANCIDAGSVRVWLGTNLLSVAAHEIGHALGISHSSERGSLMYAWYDSYNPVLKLHYDDITAIQHLYGQFTRLSVSLGFDAYPCTRCDKK